MIRYSLLVLAFTVTTAAAPPLQFGPAVRVAPFTPGTPGSDYRGTLVPYFNGFSAYWLHNRELWREALPGTPPRPNLQTAVDLGVSADAVAETINGPVILYSVGETSFVRSFTTPESAATSLPGLPDSIECNLTRCLVSADNGNILAVVDTGGLLVRLLPAPPVARYRVAWATDPHGFLVLTNTGDIATDEAISIDNDGNIRADVQIGSLGGNSAATFNGDRYAIFNNGGFGVMGFTMTAEGQVSPKKLITPSMEPEAVVWNGSEDLLVGATEGLTVIPESPRVNALSAIRIAPDLTPIDAQPFQIAPRVGGNIATSVAWNGNMFYVLWTRSFDSPFVPRPTATTVEGAAITATGEVLTHALLTSGSMPQTSPKIARGASSSVVLWSEFNIDTGTYTLRYSVNGHAVTAGSGLAIDVVPLGDDYLVVWGSDRLRAAILSAYGIWSEVALPAISVANVAVAANHDHWMIAGSMSNNLVDVTVSRDGLVSAPVTVAPLTYLYGLASDGDQFFLTAPHDFILDANGNPVAQKVPHLAALKVDFADGVYGALGPIGTFDRYDRNGNFIGSTNLAASGGQQQLSHIGSLFVIVDASGQTPLATIVSADGTLLVHDLPVPALSIARSGAPTSTAVETRPAADTLSRQTPALFIESVSIAMPPPHRSVRH